MLDDIDRDCCEGVRRLIKHSLGKNKHRDWLIEKQIFDDPGWTLVLKHHFGPNVTVKIQYGDKSGSVD